MKTNEEYLFEYGIKKQELEKRGELWRLKFTEAEFLKEIEKVRGQYNDAIKYNGFLNEYHKSWSIEGMIEVLLMDKMTAEEAVEQIRSLHNNSHFELEIPEILERIKDIKLPLKFRDSANIYCWIHRKQVSFDNLPLGIKDDFAKTRHYEMLRKGKRI